MEGNDLRPGPDGLCGNSQWRGQRRDSRAAISGRSVAAGLADVQAKPDGFNWNGIRRMILTLNGIPLALADPKSMILDSAGQAVCASLGDFLDKHFSQIWRECFGAPA